VQPHGARGITGEQGREGGRQLVRGATETTRREFHVSVERWKGGGGRGSWKAVSWR